MYYKILTSISVLVFSAWLWAAPSTISIVPEPKQTIVSKGVFSLNNQTKISYDSDKSKPTATMFWQTIAPVTGYQQPITQRSVVGKNHIHFQLDSTLTTAESYQLSVSVEQVRIRAADVAGLFYGMQSLLQLLPPDIYADHPINQLSWDIPAVEIDDQPRFSYRGMHLDVSRHFFNVDFIKSYIDWLAFHKLNVFQWHLTDDQGWRIEIKTYPKLTEVGSIRNQTVLGHTYDYQPLFDTTAVKGFYTQAQIKEVVAYAAARHVMVIPEIDIPGHSTAILAAYPELGCSGKRPVVEDNFGIFEAVLCPTEQTFAFLQQVYQEVATLFPAPYIHVGGDEVIKKQWLASPFVQQLMQKLQLTSTEQVQSYFIGRVSNIVTALGKKMIGWDEILEGGLAPNALVTSWRGEDGGVAAATLGHQVIMSPYQFVYFDAYQSLSQREPKAIHGLTTLKDVYLYEPIPAQLPASQHHLVLGAQGALWTEYIKTPQQAQYMLFPRIAAFAEGVWSQPAQRNWSLFTQKLPLLFARYQAQNIHYALSHLVPDIAIKQVNSGQSQLTIANQLDGQIQVKLVNETLDHIYSEPLLVDSNKQVVSVSARLFAPKLGLYSLPVQVSFAHHKAVGKPITLKYPAQSDGLQKLNDGIFAFDQFYRADNFAIFYDSDLEAVIDLENKTSFHQIVMGIDAGRHRQLHPPIAVSVWVSNDKQNWQRVTQLNASEINGPLLSFAVGKQIARYVKVHAVNAKNSTDPQIPKLPLYIDEIAIF
ncbi:beta-N-acetylhexosaminidase [Pseudoalteromonas tunicata]|uniref:beta-N-acetylhexosaminidase n=1 Tax=Pseudoalteromonas tunicata TaxID=314281 RepID=UPI00273E0F20|nr:beta-N-acetylhexosaminidase [Pseudoalteromonas tunicata]MDP5215083.1 beta-N-acetylhexosaminidase [Pseudoalteromonas tunicata]